MNRDYSFKIQYLFIFPLIALLLVTSLPAQAEESTAESNPYDAQYDQMVQQAQQMPEDFDFVKVRELYTKTSYYRPYSINPKIDFKPYFKRSDNGDSSALEDATTYALKHFAYPRVHFNTIPIAMKYDKDKIKYHHWAASGLTKAVLHNGDGQSPETAYKVISVPEEYWVMKPWGCNDIEQAVRQQNEGVYDVLTCKREDGTILDIWFDVTPLFKANKM